MKTSSDDTNTDHPLSISIFLVGLGIFCLVIGGFFGIRLSHALRTEPPPHRERKSDVEAIRGWMTLTYISKAYGTPMPEFEKGLSLEPGKYHQKSLTKIAQEQGIPEDAFIESTRKIITTFQASHTTPPNQ